MSKFIWVRDNDRREHFINVDHIIRVTKVPASRFLKSESYAYLTVNDGGSEKKEIKLCEDMADTFQDVVEKIAGVCNE